MPINTVYVQPSSFNQQLLFTLRRAVQVEYMSSCHTAGLLVQSRLLEKQHGKRQLICMRAC